MNALKFGSHWIKQTTGLCLVQLPLALVALLLFAASSVRAAVVYDSGGFEAPRFAASQSLTGQDPVPQPLGNGPWRQDLGTSTAVVQTDVTKGGLQSVRVTRVPGATGDTRWGINVPITPTASDNVVTIDFDLNVFINPGSNWGGPDLGPLFGVECYDASSGSPKLIGSLFLDAYAGDIVYQQATNGTLQNSGRFIPRNEYHHYTLAANFTTKTYSIYVDGTLVHTEAFVDATASAFTDAPITTLAATTNYLDQAVGTAFFDNYSISQTTSRLNYLVWQGDGANNYWDVNTSSNWINGDGRDVFNNNTPVVFDDTGSNQPAVAVQGTVEPASITINASQDYTLGGPGSVGGSGSLFKTGSGTLTLTGNNSYSGGTIVSNGTLVVNNPSGSATGSGSVLVAGGTTLGGNGIIGGSVQINNGGTLSPGNSLGTLTINGNLTLADNSALQFDIGSTSDQVTVNNNLGLSGTLAISATSGFGPGTYTLFNYGGVLTGRGAFITSAPPGYDYTINTNTPGKVNLTVSVPPSPPAAPGDLAATAISDRQIDLTWKDNSTNETAFLIERSMNNYSFTQIASVGADVTNYSDASLTAGTTYYYRVRASNAGGNSAYSAVASGTTLLSTAPPVSYYQFELNTLDSSSNNNDGVPSGALTYSSGKIGNYCASFDGTSSFVTIQPVARTNFTVAMWVQTTNTGTGSDWYNGAGLVDGEVTGSKADWGCSILNSKFALGIGSPDTTISTGIPVDDGAWHYLVATRDSASGIVKLYVDGVLNAFGSAPTGPRTDPNELRIGASQTAVPVFFKGNIDDLKIYDHVLSDQQILALASTPPVIVSQPQSQPVDAGSNATFTVTASGSAPLTYQWLFNGAPITGANSSAYSVVSAQMADAGSYSVIVSNIAGTVTSDSAALTVNSTVFDGQAAVLNMNILGVTNSWSDTGPLPPHGGAQNASLLSFSEPNLFAADVAHASTIGQGDRTRSEASVADFTLVVGSDALSANFLMAHATAVWQTNGTALDGSSEIDGLVINGQPVTITGQTNQTIPLLDGSVILNEHTNSATTLTVNALHLIVNGAADVVVSSGRAGISSPEQPSCSGEDYVSGGGWITTSSGAKGNFSVEGGTTNGVPWGHLVYKDQGTGMQVKGTSVTAYGLGSTTNSRHIEGTAAINGVDGYTYSVDTTDNGEPGTNDVFNLSLSNGYQANGTLGGGNIQLHQPCQ